MTIDAQQVRDTTRAVWFDEPHLFAEYLKTIPAQYRPTDDYSDNSNFYHWSYEKAIQMLLTGDPTYGEQAQKIIDKMQDEQIFTSDKYDLVHSVTGFVPDTLAALSGHPLEMFTIQRTENESLNAPLNIYVETLVSGGVNIKELINRGICILAFALAMTAYRPVIVYACVLGKPGEAIKTGGAIVRVPTQPLNLDQAGYMLCDAAFYRRLAFATQCHEAGQGWSGWQQWPWNCPPTQTGHTDRYKAVLGMSDQDLFFPGGYLHDEKMKEDPVGWVKDMLERYRQGTTLDSDPTT